MLYRKNRQKTEFILQSVNMNVLHMYFIYTTQKKLRLVKFENSFHFANLTKNLFKNNISVATS